MFDGRPYFLFIESNTSGTGAIFAQRAYDLGLAPVLVAQDPTKYNFADARWLRLESYNTYEMNDLLRLVDDLKCTAPIAGVFSSSEYFITQSAKLAAHLSLPGPDPTLIGSCRDKIHQRITLATQGIDTLRYRVTKTANEAARHAKRLGGSVIVKPANGSGSCNVKLCKTPLEAHAHANHLLSTAPNRPFLVEEYILGSEYSVELFDGKTFGIVDKHLSPEPHFVEIGHDYPAQLDTKLTHHISNFAEKCAVALGMTWGPVHLELRCDGQQIHLVELNPRLAGGFIPLLIRMACGVDLIEATLLKATGVEPCIDPINDGCASLRFIIPDDDGTIHHVDGLPDAQSAPGVVSAELYRDPPFDFRSNYDFRDRIGHLLVAAPEHTSAISKIEAAMADIELVFQAVGHSDSWQAKGRQK